MKIHTFFALLLPLCFSAQAQTNWITAAPHFRMVNGQLYNTEKSQLFSMLKGECVAVRSNSIVLQTFTMEPIYGVGTRTELRQPAGFGPSRQMNVPVKIRVGEERENGPQVVVTNFPQTQTGPTVGQKISARAMKVGTSDYSGMVLELWDYGTPHRVLATNWQQSKIVKKHQ